MKRQRPARMSHIQGIGVDRMGNLADADQRNLLRLENLDVNIPPDISALERTRFAAEHDPDNSYLPFLGQHNLREAVVRHVSKQSGVAYDPHQNCIISTGGLSGILNVLLATTEVGDEVIVTDPTYVGLVNRIRLAGGVPRWVPFQFRAGQTWRLDRQALVDAIGPKTRSLLLTSPSMPSGAMLDRDDWALVAELCVKHDLLLINNTAMERLVFDEGEIIHPASFPGMAERTITVGSASKELRMIGWRVGWIVAPKSYMPDLGAVSIANVVVPVGIAQDATAQALVQSHETLPAYVAELQGRRDLILEELKGFPVGVPQGGWSLLMQVSHWEIDGAQMSERLLEQGVAATPMDGWGQQHGASFIRFVFSNETQDRLKGLGKKVRAALGIG